MKQFSNDAYEVTWLVRRLFRAMAERADHYLSDSGLSAADRAVLEFVYPDKLLTVPAIALLYRVSRQHVQLTVNRLLKQGLVEKQPNPEHRRSPLYRLSPAGLEVFEEIRKNENREIDRLFDGVPPLDIATTRTTLKRLIGNLTQEPR